jgi:hypothetical protein
MNPKNTWLLLALAAGLFAFIFFFERRPNQSSPVAIKVLPVLKSNSISSIQIQPAGQLEIRADRTNDAWQLTKPIAYPAMRGAVENLLRALSELTPQSRISAHELRGRIKVDQEYGFDNPQFTLILQQGEDRPKIKLGFITPGGDQVYLQVIGTDWIDIVAADLFKFIPRTADDWRETSLVNLKGATLDRITVTNGGKALELSRSSTNTAWRMTLPAQARADNAKIEELLFKLQNVQVSRFVTDLPTADLETFGLQPPELELILTQGTNRVVSLQLGKSPTNEENLVYARLTGKPSILLLPREQFASWREPSENFRDRHLAGLTSAALDTIEVHGTEDFTLQKQTNDTWRITKPQDLPADAIKVREFIGNLSTLQIVPGKERFAAKEVVTPTDLPTYGLAAPARKYILKRNLPNSSASNSTNMVIAELHFGLKDGEMFARRADLPEEMSVYAVKEADIQRLPSHALDLRERRIWDFTENDVSRLTIRQNGKAFQVLRKAANEWWIAPGSQGSIDPFAIEAAVGELGALRAETWVERGDPNQARYGFSDNSTKLSVEITKEGKTQTLSLEFGGWSPNKLRYAGVQMGGKNWIFELPSDIQDRLVSYLKLGKSAP